MDEDVLHSAGSNKARTAAPKEARSRRRSLHPKTTDHEQRLGRVAFAEDEPEDQRVHANAQSWR
jgi:hypothetical protein